MISRCSGLAPPSDLMVKCTSGLLGLAKLNIFGYLSLCFSRDLLLIYVMWLVWDAFVRVVRSVALQWTLVGFWEFLLWQKCQNKILYRLIMNKKIYFNNSSNSTLTVHIFEKDVDLVSANLWTHAISAVLIIKRSTAIIRLYLCREEMFYNYKCKTCN